MPVISSISIRFDLADGCCSGLWFYDYGLSAYTGKPFDSRSMTMVISGVLPAK